MSEQKSQIAHILKSNEEKILKEWVTEQSRIGQSKMSNEEIKNQAHDFLNLLMHATQTATPRDMETLTGGTWEPLKKMLNDISKQRAARGYNIRETATFIFSLKRPMFQFLAQTLNENPKQYAEDMWLTTQLLDQLGLFTTEVSQKARDEVILRQQEEMLEISTPVVKLWDGILALPMIGTLDSSRTQVVMESLLQKIMDTGSEIAIIDITGVPTVDTLVAQHLLKTVTAARLMGAECIISGIRPQIAATIVHLGVDLGGVSTKASLADAFILALKKTGKSIGRHANDAAPSVYNRETRA